MSTEMDSPMAEVMRHTHTIQSALDDQVYRLNTKSFDGLDEAKTVAVTLDARQRLTGVRIKDGLLRLGAETVTRRINEAIHNAKAAATASGEADEQRLAELVDGVNSSLNDMLGPLQPPSD